MTFVKQAGLLRSARSWGVLGLVLALAGMTGSAQGRPPEQLLHHPQFTCDGEIKKGVTPNPLVRGQSAIVTIGVWTISGPCPGGSPGTVMQDPKPNGLTFTAAPTANQPGWACSLVAGSGDARCDNPSALPGGYSVMFKINATVDPTAGTSVTNCATVSTSLERNPANNKACVTTPVTP